MGHAPEKGGTLILGFLAFLFEVQVAFRFFEIGPYAFDEQIGHQVLVLAIKVDDCD